MREQEGKIWGGADIQEAFLKEAAAPTEVRRL